MMYLKLVLLYVIDMERLKTQLLFQGHAARKADLTSVLLILGAVFLHIIQAHVLIGFHHWLSLGYEESIVKLIKENVGR